MAYANAMATIAPYAEAEARNKQVESIFVHTFELSKAVKEVRNANMPKTIAQKGRLNEHPLNNVILGRKKKRKLCYKCSICGEYEHNKAKYPKK